MSQYLLLLHESAMAGNDLSPDQMQAIIQRYKKWGQSLRDRNLVRGGNKLQDGTGRTMRNNNGKLSVTDGPFAESKEVVGGYYLVEAASYDEAVALARDCPHLDFGAIEVREIEVMG